MSNDQHPNYSRNEADARSGHHDNRDRRHDHHDTHSDHRHDSPYEHNAYHGIPYPLPHALQPKSEQEPQKDLLDGTSLKTRDAIVLAMMLSGAIATEYVKLSDVENSVAVITKENESLRAELKEVQTHIEQEVTIIESEVRDIRNDLKKDLDSMTEKMNTHAKAKDKFENSTDRRLEYVESKVSELMFKARRSKSQE